MVKSIEHKNSRMELRIGIREEEEEKLVKPILKKKNIFFSSQGFYANLTS